MVKSTTCRDVSEHGDSAADGGEEIIILHALVFSYVMIHLLYRCAISMDESTRYSLQFFIIYIG